MKKFQLGATGTFPRGRVGPHDEGALAFAVATDIEHGIVRLEFGKAITWLGLPPNDVRKLAAMLLTMADELEARKKVTNG